MSTSSRYERIRKAIAKPKAGDNTITPKHEGQAPSKPRRRKKRRKASNEFRLHLAAARWLDGYPGTRGKWYHPPNGFYRPKRTAFWCREAGVKPGIPDIIIPIPCIIKRQAYTGLWIELKAPTKSGRKPQLSKDQRRWRDLLTTEGQAAYRVLTSIDELSALCMHAYPANRPPPILTTPQRHRKPLIIEWLIHPVYGSMSIRETALRAGVSDRTINRMTSAHA